MRIFLFLFLIASFAFCSQNRSSSSVIDKNRLTQEIRQTLFNYYADIKKDGLLAEFRYLDSSADFFWVPPGFTGSVSFDSVAAILKKNASLYRSINNAWDTLRVVVVSNEIATYTGKVHSKLTDTSGKVYEAGLIESGTVIKRGDKWKLLCGQTALINQ
jgi:hypothetical protein